MLKVDHLNFTDSHTREFVRLLPAAVAVVDNDMRYLTVSDRWLRDYQLDDSDIIGLSHYEVFPEIPTMGSRALAAAG